MNKNVDIILCCSKKIAYEVKKRINSDKVKAMWNPCDIDEIKKLSEVFLPEYSDFFENHEKIVVTMGREDDVKGYWHLIKAFRRIYESNNGYGLVIIGTGDFKEYKEMVKKLEIDNNVLFTGVQKNPFCYLRQSDVFALSSLSEGLPNALVEAMAVGLPIVSVNCESGPAEILEDDWKLVDTSNKNFKAKYGILTPAFSDEKNMDCKIVDNSIILKFKTMEILSNEVIAEKYKNAGKKRCVSFSKETYFENIISCIEQLGEK